MKLSVARSADQNRAFYGAFKVEPAGTEGQMVYELGNGQWDQKFHSGSRPAVGLSYFSMMPNGQIDRIRSGEPKCKRPSLPRGACSCWS